MSRTLDGWSPGFAAQGTVRAPEALQQNVAVGGINLLALRDRIFRIGGGVLRGSGLCAPCWRMQEALGRDGFTTVRGHGGITRSRQRWTGRGERAALRDP